jgi:hypothetical protein
MSALITLISATAIKHNSNQLNCVSVKSRTGQINGFKRGRVAWP